MQSSPPSIADGHRKSRLNVKRPAPIFNGIDKSANVAELISQICKNLATPKERKTAEPFMGQRTAETKHLVL